MSKREFRYHSIEPEGLWTSEVFGPSDHRHIVQGVVGGWLNGRPRWATDLEGNFIYGLDAKGKEMKSAPKAHAIRGHATRRSSGSDIQVGDCVTMRAEHRRFLTSTTGSEVFKVVGRDGGALVLEGPLRYHPKLRKQHTMGAHQFKKTACPRDEHAYHATKKSPKQLDAEIAEILAKVPFIDDPVIRAKYQIDPSELRVGQRFDYFGRPFEIVKIGRDKDKTIQIASRYTKPSGKEDFIDHRSFPLRRFYEQHLRPIR